MSDVGTEVVLAGSRGAIERAVAVLKSGGLVAFPTDTVYGLAAHPASSEAVARICRAKGRDPQQPIALLLADADQLPKVASVSQAVQPLVRRFWPGGLTLVLPLAVPAQGDDEAGLDTTVGVRVPALPLARDLIRAAGGFLPATSANRSGEPPSHTAGEVLRQLGGRIELILDGGRCRGGVPSTVLDCTVWPPVVLRSGAVPEGEIRSVLGHG